MKPIIYLLIVLSLGLFSASNTLDNRPEKRIALVIGNSDYIVDDLDLTNPVNDAQVMKDALEKMDFEVQIVKDGTKEVIRNALDIFDKKNLALDKEKYKTVALFYYSGHGMRVNGTNYIVPTNAKIQSLADLEEFAVSSDWIVRRMEAQSNYLSLLMFDACRDNPLTKSMAAYFKKQNPTKSSYYTSSLFTGLNTQEPNSTGVIISYAADAGETADEGGEDSKVSPYVAAYLKYYKTPGLPVEMLFGEIGKDVVADSRYTQHPIFSSKFYQKFSFKRSIENDSDNDGFSDEVDDCPDKYSLTNNGCPEKDVDNDGFLDKVDDCPYEYSQTNNGCPEIDTDKDGILDEIDQCPNFYAETSTGCPAIINSLKKNMIYVKGGIFKMGGIKNYEIPSHEVELSDFYISKYEVTVKEYLKFDSTYFINNTKISNKTGYDKEEMDNLPITAISWDSAVAYCKWLSKITGDTYCLPTEAQWEYAAKGGEYYDKNELYSGSKDIVDVAWYDTNSDKKIHVVGSKQANSLGIYDMSGNVWEWCSDWYGKEISGTNHKDPTGPKEGKYHVIRGGALNSGARACRVTNRYYDKNQTKLDIGFRVVRKIRVVK